MNFIITLLIFFLILSLIIVVHEFGHFIVAKKSGVYVDEFSLGMGPKIIKYKPKKSETTYSIRLFPIGGFVSMAEKEEFNDKKIKKDRVLENKSFFIKFLVFINGILFNFLLAIVLFFISGLIYGRPISEPIIDEVKEGMPAYNSGISKGDKIISVNDNKIKTFEDFLVETSGKKPKKEYIIKVEKKDKSIQEYTLTPKVEEVQGQELRVFGFIIKDKYYKKSFKDALIYSIEGFYNSFISIVKIVSSLFTGEVAVKSLSGPVGIFSLIDTVKTEGLEILLFLTAYLSINVGIINLIPIPVFDGGRVLILLIEKIIRKKSSVAIENILNVIGFGLMILLMIYVSINDIIRLW